MHNGNIAHWGYVKRALAMGIGERWFNVVHGSTDSEWAFALFLDCLEDEGIDPDSDDANKSGFGHAKLRRALLRTIERINALVSKFSPEEKYRDSGSERSLLNFAITDGHSVVCTKYVNSKTDEAASLYFSSGTSWSFTGEMGQFKMERKDKGADIVLVASEPLTFERGIHGVQRSDVRNVLNIHIDNWVTLPTNSVITIHKQTVMIHPIIDEFYNHKASHQRSSGYAINKGLISHPPGDIHERTIPGAEKMQELKDRLDDIVM